MDLKKTIEEFVDYLVPRLDTYEQVIYLYILRHGCLQSEEELTIGFKSARRNLGFGVGLKGRGISEGNNI